jgi:uncharacterized iron-regulated protein
MTNHGTRIVWATTLLLLLQGCQSSPPSVLSTNTPPRSLPILNSRTAQPEAFQEVVDSLVDVQVVVLGEEHDDLLAHRFQVELVEALHEKRPELTLALEMVERDHQEALDQYLTGSIDVRTFVDEVRSEERGQKTFERHSLPLINLAKRLGIKVIAANAPRTYVRAARIEGYEYLESLPEETRRLYDMPAQLDAGPYRRRVEQLMQSNGVVLEQEQVDAFMRAQEMWDQTMARSVIEALNTGGEPVVLVVGRFHGDFGGGTINRILADAPETKVRYLVTIGSAPGRLRLDDADRADHILYTGKPGS